MSLLGPLPRCAGAQPVFTVERSSIDPPQWSVYSVTPQGGVGARAFGPFDHKTLAERWAGLHGELAEPIDEAA